MLFGHSADADPQGIKKYLDFSHRGKTLIHQKLCNFYSTWF